MRVERECRDPHSTVVERLQERGIPIYRTDQDGLMTVRSDGRYLTWHTPGVERSTLPAFGE